MLKRSILTLAVGAILMALPATATAAQPTNPSCWGAASADFARSSPGALGAHSSSFDSPRLGIGNVAELFTGTHQPGDLAAALGFVCG